ncbi:hypothetical protein [Candidatus Protofrankia californiensis]|uniref:hypothetical protein n=1 Tax=Candidatus Protofrankia californiensis TaxID=1839754 RepID=UPI001F498047|nr:hypothetical protein [Candidatus Protofrankia californiensis]
MDADGAEGTGPGERDAPAAAHTAHMDGPGRDDLAGRTLASPAESSAAQGSSSAEPVVADLAEPPAEPPVAQPPVADAAVSETAVSGITLSETAVGEDAVAIGDAVGAGAVDVPAFDVAVVTAAAMRLDDLAHRVEELVRLRRHDADLVDRLHAENTRLRAGELTEAMSPLLRGLMRLHDQMTSLGADDGQSIAGILRTQLLQVMDVAVDVRPYTAVVGTPFDPARHVGVRRIGTDDSERDRTIARTVRPGFVRGESILVRPAEVEVFRAH